ncbi:MAG: group II intron reverse transcriptase domain-containing protein [Verrucomicrobiales bacterium]|nr:group II intron reverse transcriptase domain-containing protein [Verrucomicrobiales bacterium]
MKAIGGLFERIATVSNVAAAAWRAAMGKRGRRAVRAFFADFESNVNRLTRELTEGSFRFDGYTAFAIRDPKTRIIHAPSLRDRVVHHAMIAVLGPVFEKGAIVDSYACRKGKGQHAAVARVRSWLRRGDAFLKADVAKYYDSIPHDRLLQALARRFRERRVLGLCKALLDSYAHRPGHGLPIGALTSQYLGNFYLDPVDHWVNEELGISRYLRYMDDMLFLGEPALLRRVRNALAERLALLGLSMKHHPPMEGRVPRGPDLIPGTRGTRPSEQGGVINHAAQGVPWLGFTIYPDRIRLNSPGRRRLRRRLRQLETADLPPLELQSRATSLFAHACQADDVAWRRVVCQFSRFGDTPGPEPRDPRRLLEQHGQEVPLRLPQQEASAQPQQEPRFPGSVGVPRHEGEASPPDDACSCAPAVPTVGDRTTGKTRPPAERRVRMGVTKAGGRAPAPGKEAGA